jgi:import inner membrane translocase subunit TIM44
MQRLASLHTAYEESESPLVTPIRAVTSTIGSWFEENETAQVTRMMRALDPSFSREAFERELREYIVPEVVDAYLSADRESLVKWCSEAVSVCARNDVPEARRYFHCRRITFFGQPWNSISARAS